MPTLVSYTLVPSSTPTDSVVVPAANDAATPSPIDAFLGVGLLAPFARDQKSDFVSGRGVELIKSSIRRIVGVRGASETAQGELRWRTEFGSQLYRLRHSNNDDVLADIARVYVVDAITRWEPRVSVLDVVIERAASTFGPNTVLRITVRFGVINQNVPSNRVFLAVDQVDVDMPIAA